MDEQQPISGQSEPIKKPKPKMGTYNVGKGKPPASGKIKKGEVRNPYGAKGKPKPAKLKPTVNEMLVNALTRLYQVQRNSDIVNEEALQILIESMIGNAIKSGKPKDAIEVMKYVEKAGAFMDINRQREADFRETEQEKRREFDESHARMEARMREHFPNVFDQPDYFSKKLKTFVQVRGEASDLDQGMIGE